MATMNKISGYDTAKINRWARLYSRDNNVEALVQAAEFYELAATPEEKYTVTWWWHEGCRDYAKDMKHLEELEVALLSTHAEIYTTPSPLIKS